MRAVLVAQRRFDELQGARNVGQAFRQGGNAELLDIVRRAQRKIHLNAAAVAEFIALPQTFGDDEDVAEQNRRVKIKSLDGLQRDLGGQFGRADQCQKRMFALEFAIFRQGAPCLPHQPDRRAVHRPAAAGVQETLAVGQRGCPGFGLIGGNGGHFSTTA